MSNKKGSDYMRRRKNENYRFVFDITSFIIVIIEICIFIVICTMYIYSASSALNKLKNELRVSLGRSAIQINSEFENCMNSAIKIATNTEFISLLERDYLNSIETKLSVSNKISSYIDMLSPGFESEDGSVCVYSDNATLYKTMYLKNMEKIDNPSVVNELYEQKASDGVWCKDDYGFVFYKRIETNNHHNLLQIKISQKRIKTLMPESERFYFTLDNEAESEDVCFKEKLNNGYVLSVIVPSSEVRGIYVRNGIIFGVIFIALAALLYFVSKGIARALTNDVYRLIAAINGNDYVNSIEKVTIKKYRDMEIIRSKLVEQLRMINTLHRSIEELEEKKKIAELETLQAKFNPHLLYNTLSVVKWDVMRGMKTDAAKILDRITEYYRMVFNGETVIYLEEEVNLSQKYVGVMRLAREEDIYLSVNVDEKLREFKLLKMTLQPLIENSILHGRSKNIEIYAKETDDCIEVGVRDNGYGMDPSKVNELNSENDETESKYKNFGIRNTRNRLFLFFGEERFKLAIESKQNSYTDVRLIIIKSEDI